MPGWCGASREEVWPKAHLDTDFNSQLIRVNFTKASATRHCWDPDSVQYKIYQRYVEDGWDQEDKQAAVDISFNYSVMKDNSF